MRWFHRKDPAERHVAMLAKTAQLELSLGMGSYQDTLAEMNSLIDQLEQARKVSRSAEDELIDALRRQVGHLETIVHHRELEYDRLEERFCQLQDRPDLPA